MNCAFNRKEHTNMLTSDKIGDTFEWKVRHREQPRVYSEETAMITSIVNKTENKAYYYLFHN